MSDDFYIGYLPKSPDAQGRFTRRIVVAALAIIVAVALALTFGHEKLPAANFDFDKIQGFQGTIEASPYPSLVSANDRYLLVAPGKHGAAEQVSSFRGKAVQLQAKRIYRDGRTMLEVIPGSVQVTSPVSPVTIDDVELGNVSLIGEIVDSKCYTGVMNPGSGKVHRDCAARCISGGSPPLFVAKDRNGNTLVYVLAGADGKPLNREVLQRVAEPVRIEGKAARRGNALLLYADPQRITPVPEATIRSWGCQRKN